MDDPIDGHELRRLRLAYGVTQKQLADAAGVKQSMISQIETGKRPMPRGEDPGNPKPMWVGIDGPTLKSFIEDSTLDLGKAPRGAYRQRGQID